MIHFIRAMFIVLVSIVASAFIWSTLNGPDKTAEATVFNSTPYLILAGAVVISFSVITIDVLYRKKNLSALSGLLFGILVGVLISLCLGYLIDQIAVTFLYRSPHVTAVVRGSQDLPKAVEPPRSADLPAASRPAEPEHHPAIEPRPGNASADRTLDDVDTYNDSLRSLLQGIKLMLGLVVTYLTTSFVLQTKDDFRFIIPYVEFQRATKGPRPIILDTSVIVDGRIADLATTGMFETTIIVPRFVLNELQTIADSGDRLKRARGRRGLDMLEKLKGLPRLELRFWDGTLTNAPPDEGVDQKLVSLAQQENGRIVTNDFNLNKVATLRGVNVINLNAMADALKPVVLPGESMKVRIVKPGENVGQGVGYLEDGTMVVVEGARDKVGIELEIVVTNMIQNPAGKMIFGRILGNGQSVQAPHRTPQ
jgi:uncharacterized protein YacL